MTLTLDHVYVSVHKMDRAVAFYEDLLNIKVCHREDDTWADFDIGHGLYFGLIDPNIVDTQRTVGNNAVPVFRTDDIDAAYAKIQHWGCTIIQPPENLNYTDYPYRCLQFLDTEGNLVEIAKYERP